MTWTHPPCNPSRTFAHTHTRQTHNHPGVFGIAAGLLRTQRTGREAPWWSAAVAIATVDPGSYTRTLRRGRRTRRRQDHPSVCTLDTRKRSTQTTEGRVVENYVIAPTERERKEKSEFKSSCDRKAHRSLTYNNSPRLPQRTLPNQPRI